MGSDFQDMSTAPTLTLDPFQGMEEKKPPVQQQKEEPALDDSILTEEERRTVDAFAKQIDLTNSTLVLQYGAGTQKKMADFPSQRWRMCGQKTWEKSETFSAES